MGQEHVTRKSKFTEDQIAFAPKQNERAGDQRRRGVPQDAHQRGDLLCLEEELQRHRPVRTSTIASARGRESCSEFISKVRTSGRYERGVELDFSRLGKPTDNARVESFNGRLRQEWPLYFRDRRVACRPSARNPDGQARAGQHPAPHRARGTLTQGSTWPSRSRRSTTSRSSLLAFGC